MHKINKIICTYADNDEYLVKAKRQAKNIKEDHIIFTPDTLDCPAHRELHCGFKWYAINRCMERGYCYIAWFDSSIMVYGDLDEYWNKTKRKGYVFFGSEYIVKDWLSDNAINILGKKRDELTYNSLLGGVMFLNFNHKCAWDFFNLWQKYLPAFQCPINNNIYDNRIRDNKNGEASKDFSVKGHRSQAVQSVIAHDLGMTDWEPALSTWRYKEPAILKVDGRIYE